MSDPVCEVDDTVEDIDAEFAGFKHRLANRKSGELTCASNVYEKSGAGRRRSSVMIEYFRKNYMGVEASGLGKKNNYLSLNKSFICSNKTLSLIISVIDR